MSKKHKAKKPVKARRPDTAKKAPEKKTKMPQWMQNIWKKFSENRGLSAIIAALAVVLVVALVVAFTVKIVEKNRPKGPGVKISEDFYHETPEGKDVKNIVQLKDNDAKDYLCAAGNYSLTAQPKPYEKGWYIFDRFGVARRYRDENGKIHDLPPAEQIEHPDVVLGDGIPLQIFGGVKSHFLVYKNAEGNMVDSCYMYFVLTDKADMACLLDALMGCGFVELQQVSDTVAEVVLDGDTLSDELTVIGKEVNLENCLEYLKQQYGVKA